MQRAHVESLPYAQIKADLAGDFGAKRVLVSKADISMDLYRILAANSAVELVPGKELVTERKAEKNPTECENMRICHVYDGVAMVKGPDGVGAPPRCRRNPYGMGYLRDPRNSTAASSPKTAA